MKPRIVLVPLACLFLFVEGCSPKTNAAPTPAADARKPPAGNVPAAPAAAAPAPVVVPAPVPAATPAPAAPVRPFDESLLRGREFLLEAASARQFVQDPDLGTLGTDTAVTRAAEAFFREAKTGKLSTESLVPRWASYLQGWAKRYQLTEDSERRTVRVGAGIPAEEGLLLVPVRLNGGKAPLQGWLALVRDGETWLVSDVQVVETAPRTGPYDPESPPQEISSPSLR